MRHSSQSDEAPPTSCSEVFQGGACDLDPPAPSSLARSSSASDIMEPFIAERVKGEDPRGDPVLIPDLSHGSSTATSLLATNNHTAQSISQPLTSPSPTPLTFPNGVVSSPPEAQDDASVYDQSRPQVGSQSRGSSSDFDWNSAFNFSCEKEVDAEDGEGGAEGEEEDLFSAIRDYLIQKGGERKEEAGEANSPAAALENMAPASPLVQTGVARSQLEYAGQPREAKQVLREVSKSVRHSSVDSTEENEGVQRSIYEFLELQCQSPTAKAASGLEKTSLDKREIGGLNGKFDTQSRFGQDNPHKEVETNDKSSFVRQDAISDESTPESTDPTKVKMSRSTKKLNPGSVHVSFRPSTESVQFHNPLENKEAHWKARLRRLSHFHTYSHSAGERAGAGAAGKQGAGASGKFSSVAGGGYKSGVHENLSSGTVPDCSWAVESRLGAAGEKGRQHSGSHVGCSLGSDVQSDVFGSSGSSGSSGVRGRLGRSALRSRVSRSRSQEPGSTTSRHHQGALLGGVYKTVVHALSSKPRPRGQGSSQGSSPQRQGRAAMGDASLKDLYSHVLGYFGRKTTTPGEDCVTSAHRGHSR